MIYRKKNCNSKMYLSKRNRFFFGWGSMYFLALICAIHSEDQSVRQGGENSPFLL